MKKGTIDWEEQWTLFAQNFKEGKAHIQVGDKILQLFPGGGFGDLSHPTTCLMLEMMEGRMENGSILDIGTGSGILALSALLLGAKEAIGIDIDPEALIHAEKNALLNHLSPTFAEKIPSLFSKKQLILMNMIFSEQKGVFPQRLNPFASLWITSGILKREETAYLSQTAEWGWILKEKREKGEWCGFVFSPFLS